jgi:hypothetical protein
MQFTDKPNNIGNEHSVERAFYGTNKLTNGRREFDERR